MALESFDEPNELYRARLAEVNPRRPLFTGDVLENIPIPGVQENGMGIIVAHACSMRGRNARLEPAILAVAVRPHAGHTRWAEGHFDKMPLPELREDGQLHVAMLDEIGRTPTDEIRRSTRLACLSVRGINLLQHRLIFHLTRFAVPTHQLYEASAHTIEEADILEDWCDTLCEGGWSEEAAAAELEQFLRQDRGSGRNHQDDLKLPQLRASVRSACRAEARRLSERATDADGVPSDDGQRS